MMKFLLIQSLLNMEKNTIKAWVVRIMERIRIWWVLRPIKKHIGKPATIVDLRSENNPLNYHGTIKSVRGSQFCLFSNTGYTEHVNCWFDVAAEKLEIELR